MVRCGIPCCVSCVVFIEPCEAIHLLLSNIFLHLALLRGESRLASSLSWYPSRCDRSVSSPFFFEDFHRLVPSNAQGAINLQDGF